MRHVDTEALRARLLGWGKQYRAVLLVVLAGLILLLLPERKEPEAAPMLPSAEPGREEVQMLEAELETALSRIEGVGEAEVVLTLESGPRRLWMQDGVREADPEGSREERTTVTLSCGSGREEPLPLQQISPQFRGALVVCSGGGDPGVRLTVAQAVSAVTGLGADKISICKGK